MTTGRTADVVKLGQFSFGALHVKVSPTGSEEDEGSESIAEFKLTERLYPVIEFGKVWVAIELIKLNESIT